MKYIVVIAEQRSTDTIRALAEKEKAESIRQGAQNGDDLMELRILLDEHRVQSFLDNVQTLLGAQPSAQVIVMPVETIISQSAKEKTKENKAAQVSRERLYTEVETGSRLNVNFVALVVLSTIVATIGLIENNIAVVIGAMVIAPLLGPNLALSLASTLGDLELAKKSIRTLLSGLFIAMLMATVVGMTWQGPLDSPELMGRTTANVESILLALASGAAATLSITTGLSGVLVGVMVAVALLPPAVTFGIMLGAGNYSLAFGAILLLAINIVSVNLASKLVFLAKGVSPRTWFEKENAQKASRRYLFGWAVTLTLLAAIVLLPKVY
ncbi:MAG: TIGR00341 family protein [Aestuariibacter sp.]